MTELEKLGQWLEANGAQWKTHSTPWGEEDQIVVFNAAGWSIWDAVCHKHSYGGDCGLIEVYDGKDVLGWLTAADVIARIDVRDFSINLKGG